MLIGQLLLCGCNCLLYHIINDLDKDPENLYEIIIKYLVVTLIFVFLFSFTIAIGPICWIFLAEIMTEVGMGLAVAANWTIITTISLYPVFGPNLPQSNKENLVKKDFSYLFFVFCGSWILAFFLISLFVKETKDMTPYQIMKLYWEVDYDAITDE